MEQLRIDTEEQRRLEAEEEAKNGGANAQNQSDQSSDEFEEIKRDDDGIN